MNEKLDGTIPDINDGFDELWENNLSSYDVWRYTGRSTTTITAI
jgi:hypothetical protein